MGPARQASLCAPGRKPLCSAARPERRNEPGYVTRSPEAEPGPGRKATCGGRPGTWGGPWGGGLPTGRWSYTEMSPRRPAPQAYLPGGSWSARCSLEGDLPGEERAGGVQQGRCAPAPQGAFHRLPTRSPALVSRGLGVSRGRTQPWAGPCWTAQVGPRACEGSPGDSWGTAAPLTLDAGPGGGTKPSWLVAWPVTTGRALGASTSPGSAAEPLMVQQRGGRLSRCGF